MRRPKRGGRNNNRNLALRLGIIFVKSIKISVEWGNIPPTQFYSMKRVNRFGKSKTTTQRRRDNCLSKRV